MALVKFSTFVAGLSADTIGGSEKIPVIDTSPFHVTPDLISAYVIDQIHGATVITSLTDTHQLPVFTSGDDERIITFANVSAWIVDQLEAITTGTTIVSGDTVLYVDSGVLKQIDIDTITTFVNTAVLDLSTLTADTPTASDLFLFNDGSPKKITLTNLETKLWSDFATYVDGLAENTTVTATDKIYSIQGGTPKWVDPDALATYFSVPNGDVLGPVTTTENNIPQWDATAKTLKDGLTLVTTVRDTGSALDTAVPTEQAVREAIGGITELDIDGATDIGAALDDVDLIIVDDGAGGTNRKAAMSRVFDYIEDKIQGLSAKTTPVSADILTIQDSAASNALKELTVGNLTTFVGAIANLDIDGGTDIGADLTDADLFIVDDGGAGTNRKCAASRVWNYVEDNIQAAPSKAVPVDADIVVIQDSANSNVITELTVGDLKTYVSSAAGVQNNYTSTTNPGVGDDSGDGYSEGSVWINNSTGTAFICTDDTLGAAVWKSTTAAAAGWDGDITDTDFSTGADIGADLADGDQIVVADNSDADSAKRSAMSRVKTYANKIDVATYASNQTLTAAECNGYVIYVTGAATITLPAIAAGMSVTLIAIGAVAVTIDPNSADKIWLDGTALDDGDKILSGSVAGDIAVLTYYSADGWHASTNNWTDAGQAFDLAGASYESKSFSVTTQETEPTGMFFKPDGTKLYVIGTANDTVYQYTLSTAWDISTASYDSKSFSVASQETIPTTLFFEDDGTTMYALGTVNDTVYQYTLSTAWDVSTASYASKSFSVTTQAINPNGLAFKSDGTKMYVIDVTNDTVYQYGLSTAWDVSTASYDSKSADISTQETAPQAVSFNSDGTKMYVVGSDNDTVYQYTLSTAWDVSTASYDSKSADVSSQETIPTALFFKSDGAKMYVLGQSNDTVYQYSLDA